MEKAGPSTPKKTRKKRSELSREEKSPPRKQRFRPEWLQNSDFRGWLAEVRNDPYRAQCIACNCTLAAGHSELLKHSKRESHKKAAMIHKNQPSVGTYFHGASNKERSLKDNIKKLEIILSGVFAEHNISMNTIDHLMEALKLGIPDSETVKGVNLHRTKCSSIVKNVIAKAEKDKLIEILKTNKFFILVDEGTDISKVQIIAVLVRYICEEDSRVATQLIECISHDARSSTAEALSKVVKSCFTEKDIPLSNIIAMAADNASVLVGKNNSLMTRLQMEADKSFMAIRCICHSLHIVASKASAKLPRNVEDFIRNIASYFSHSSKRQAQLSELQEFLSAERLKILRPVDTRWLAMQHCIERILNQWEVLKLLFFQAQTEDKLISAEIIMREFNNPYSKAYLVFLKYVLGYFNQMNALFQSKTSLIGILQDESIRMTRVICKNFIKAEFLDDLSKVEPENSSHLLPLKEISLGRECESILSSIDDETSNIDHFRIRCLHFYQTAFVELINRLPLFDPLFKELKFICPKIALNIDCRKSLPKLDNLVMKYGHLLESESDVQQEGEDLPAYFSADERDLLLKKNCEELWLYLSNLRNFSDQYVFRNLAILAKVILILPHSNAETERIFSLMADAKTKKRNRMGPELLDSLLFINSNMKSKGKNCLDFAKEIQERHLALHNQQMYDHKE